MAMATAWLASRIALSRSTLRLSGRLQSRNSAGSKSNAGDVRFVRSHRRGGQVLISGVSNVGILASGRQFSLASPAATLSVTK